MLSIKKLSGGGGDIYGYLAQGDYYSEGDRVTGVWFGKAAKLLGLSGAVGLQDFENIRQSNDPRTGEFLRQRRSKNKMIDLCFSAPKSVSILARPGGDARLHEAHRIAVVDALTQIERETACEVQKNRQKGDRKTGSMIAAIFEHDTSRELDPQLHSHCAVGNMTYDPVEQRWKAFNAEVVFQRKAYFQEVYRNSLAREVMKLGYEIETRSAGRKGDRCFEIVGIDKSLCKKFSKMSGRIAEAVGQFIEKYRKSPTDREVGELARSGKVRPKKMYEVSSAEVAERQQSQLSEKEKVDLVTVVTKAKARAGREPQKHNARNSVQYALDHLFERRSVERDYDLVREALTHSRGNLSIEEIEKAMGEMQKEGVLFSHEGNVATRQTLDMEKQIIWLAVQGTGKFDRLNKSKGFIHGRNEDGSDLLNGSQKKAVDFVLGSHDFIVNLRGAPGTGKTHTLREVYRGLTEATREVIALAPTRSAKDELKEVGMDAAKTFTVEKLIQDKFAGERMRNKVVMVDEAGMLSNRQMFELLRLGRNHNARFVFSGDTKQIQSVEAGDALLSLEREAAIATYELTEIIRQKDSNYRFAIELMRENPQEAFDILDMMGAIKEVPYFDRPAAVAAAAKGKRDVLVVGATHDENSRINEALRVGRESRTLTRMEPLNWTEAQRRDLRNYEPGQYLLFHKRTSGGEVDNAYCVTGVTRRFVETVDLAGEKVLFSQKQAKAFGVFAEKKVEVSIGDRVIFNANCKRDGFDCTNGHQALVTSFDKAGRPMVAPFNKNGIAIEDRAQSLPSSFFQFNHGYAVTSHKSQGKTVDEVIVSADRMNRELFYVSASRGRDGITIFTTDKEELREAIGVSGERPTALELERQCNAAAGNTPRPAASAAESASGIEFRRRKIRNEAAESYRDSFNPGTQEAEDTRDLRDHSITYATWLNSDPICQEIGGRGGV